MSSALDRDLSAFFSSTWRSPQSANAIAPATSKSRANTGIVSARRAHDPRLWEDCADITHILDEPYPAVAHRAKFGDWQRQRWSSNDSIVDKRKPRR